MHPLFEPVLDATHAAFIASGPSILVASRNAANVPSVARAIGCRISPGLGQVMLFLSASQSRALLDDVRATRTLAAIFDEPPTHRAIQIKGDDAQVGALEAGDPERIAAYTDAFVFHIERVGYAERWTRTFLAAPEQDYVAVTFTPNAAFTQTPGPNAGAPLRR